uniref:Anaerobic ribonucleoside-triphosphate reductase activating protein n=1 Tax=Candidatus Kentrum sp. MB TaxID=2138164 RepID=A0A450X5Q3_9GAMM|nr:MAG: anaerobic ribonucleoside-triphosphate reductase activating protein [Candidatus Kentron sp. MB]VFK27100.1 MAG: anaerobic ribonucleoside-triphosphate reductase activating protein [Candidatus Kentron sp. MB]VFK74908.1 MAG: anaerobic ribonucleoside-triphosphate reductase activating protein [Candidatus Kentron sp. MB]
MCRILHVARWSKRCTVLGPGIRAVIWVQGCPFRCQGCVAPETLPFAGGEHLEVERLANDILALDYINGVTFSGGEPMSQPAALSVLVDCIRRERDLSFMSYTGFTLKHLINGGTVAQKRLLSLLDILVDGPYVRKRHTDLKWRGSDNQRVIFLSDRHQDCKNTMNSRGTNIEFEIDHNTLHWMGIPPVGFREKFEERMQSWGLDLTHSEEKS